MSVYFEIFQGVLEALHLEELLALLMESFEIQFLDCFINLLIEGFEV